MRLHRIDGTRLVWALCILLPGPVWPAGGASAEVPFPAPPGGVAAQAYERYCFLPTPDGVPLLPKNYRGGSVWKYSSQSSGYEETGDNPGATGMSVDRAWEITTGRPDVVIAVIDSGVTWRERHINNKFRLNRAELPLPRGSSVYDANGNGVFNVEDYSNDGRVQDVNGNGFKDPQDLILTFSDRVDDDGNGYVDDICGWDLVDDDNDPYDDVDYGHGTGESKDSCAEAYSDREDGFPGTCPNCMILPVRVGLSYMAEDSTFGRAVIFSVDSGAGVIQEALGAVNYTDFASAAVAYAYAGDVPVVASAADESSMHQNIPAVHEHTIVMNSVTRYEVGMDPPSYLYLNGCTNYGGNIDVSVSSTSCSSEAVGRGAGIAGLIVSAARDRMARGDLASPLTAGEVEQLLTMSADDIDFSGNYGCTFPGFPSSRFPSGPGWDPYFGYGRVNARRAVEMVRDGRIPPEADILRPAWFETFDPTVTPTVPIEGTVAANRAASYRYVVEVARGIQPGVDGWEAICESSSLDAPAGGVLCEWDVRGFADEVSRAPAGPNDFTFSVRVVVLDANGNRGISRKTVYLHHDADLKSGYPIHFGSSGEASVLMVDLDGDNVEEMVVPTSSGVVHALNGDGTEIDGWPVHTDLVAYRYEDSLAHVTGAVDATLYEPIGYGGAAAGDLDGDGDLEVVVHSLAGKVYAWEHGGALRDGFPVTFHPPYSLNPAVASCEPAFQCRDKFNRRLFGAIAAPVLEDLDLDGRLEIISAALDNHVYVWQENGETMPGWPVLVVDAAMVDVVDPATHRVAPGVSAASYEMGKIISTPAVGDINDDGFPELLLGTNEQYDEPMNIGLLSGFWGLVGRLEVQGGNTRLHALYHDGNGHSGGPFVSGWPVPIALVTPELVPYVAYGMPGSPALADVDGDGALEIAAFSSSGPLYLLHGDGTSYYGNDPWGNYNTMGQGFLFDTRHDMPTTPGLGSPIFADLKGDGSILCIAPSVGWAKLSDTLLPADQLGDENHMTAWDPLTGDISEGFPAFMDDLQFATHPGVLDLDGDGAPEAVSGSGGFLVRAYNGEGQAPAGWPKFTGTWIVSVPSAGDVDGDGLLEVAVMTRMGWLYVWETLGQACDEVGHPWRTFHHDVRHTGHYGRDVVAPFRPLDFQAVRAGSRIRFSWTAVGDNGACGGSVAYHIRGHTSDLEGSWQTASEVETITLPHEPGTRVDIETADGGFPFYGIQAMDAAGNVSRIASVAPADLPNPIPGDGEAQSGGKQWYECFIATAIR